MNDRFQALVHGAALALIIGWVLYIGQDVFIPVVFGILVFYVVVGLTRLLFRVPLVGRHLPHWLRYTLSMVLIGLVLVVILYAALMLVEQHVFESKRANLSRDPHTVARIRQLTTDVNARIGSYLGLKTMLSLLLGVLSWAVMAVAGLEFAVFWAVLIGLLNFIPYIGTVLGVFFPVLMAVVQFDSASQIFAVLVPLAIVQFVIGNIIDPLAMGSSLNLSPLAILVSLAVWTGLWGVPGAFLAVPITAILTIILSEFPGTRPIAVLLSRNGKV